MEKNQPLPGKGLAKVCNQPACRLEAKPRCADPEYSLDAVRYIYVLLYSYYLQEHVVHCREYAMSYCIVTKLRYPMLESIAVSPTIDARRSQKFQRL